MIRLGWVRRPGVSRSGLRWGGHRGTLPPHWHAPLLVMLLVSATPPESRQCLPACVTVADLKRRMSLRLKSGASHRSLGAKGFLHEGARWRSELRVLYLT